MRLAGKSAIITGSATGIGQAIASCFAREGASVVIDYVAGQESVANQCVANLKQHGGNALAVMANVTDEGQVQSMVDATVKQFGKLDIFVNNAGIEHKVPFVDIDRDLWEKTISVNLTGPFVCSQVAARQMIKQGSGGRIINISSVHEDIPMPTNAAYCASKGGLRMLMRTMCVELAPHQITVNNIGPGATDTPMDEELKKNKPVYNQLLDHIPLHRMAQPDEIGNCAVFLASDEAAYVTGSTYFVDGGMMRWATSL
jgi:glucose 1-dehydrogenase